MKYQIAIIGGGPCRIYGCGNSRKGRFERCAFEKGESWRSVSERGVYSYQDFIVLCKNV